MVSPNESATWEGPAVAEEGTPASVEVTTEPLIVPLIAGETPDAPLDGEIPAISTEIPSPLVASDAPVLDDHTRERLARADQLEARESELEMDRAIEEQIQRYRVDLDRRGLSVEDQEWLVDQQSQTLRSTLEQQRKFRSDQAFLIGQQWASFSIGQELGVDPSLLANAPNPTEMRKIAVREKRYQDQEKRLQTLEQGRVPGQHVNTVGTTRAGGQAVTSDNIDMLHVQGRVNDVTYRRFLDTGIIR